MEHRRQQQQKDEDPPHDKTKPRISIEIGKEQKIISYYETSFTAIQQRACREIAKNCIKVIEPGKQKKHPYIHGDDSKPDWWPAEVTHLEPDHLKKPGMYQPA